MLLRECVENLLNLLYCFISNICIMWILLLIKDMFLYPFKKSGDKNTFESFLNLFLKEYPAYIRNAPAEKKIRRVLLLPFIFVWKLFSFVPDEKVM